MANAAFTRLNQWRVWADRRLLAAAANLSPAQLAQEFPIGQGSYLKSLQHLQMAESVWINRLTGRPGTLLAEIPVPADLAALETEWNRTDAVWQEYIERLDDVELARMLVSTGRGFVGQMSVMDILLHVSTHAAYTHAQANNILRQLGKEPVVQMMATMSRAENEQRK